LKYPIHPEFTLIIKEVFFLFGVEIGVEESIVNEPLVLKTLIFQTLIKNTNNAKSKVRFKQLRTTHLKKTDFSNCILKIQKVRLDLNT
jgi:hypothetical protein